MTESSVPAIGATAPDFTLKDQYGQDVSLAGFRGDKAVVVVFFPFAFSGICTGELCEIRDDLGAFANDDVQVLAVSCDHMFTQRAYADAQGYFFPVLSDFWPHGAGRPGLRRLQAGRRLRHARHVPHRPRRGRALEPGQRAGREAGLRRLPRRPEGAGAVPGLSRQRGL